ncbi:hypothetical protein GGTG_10877 [Gaeumannomyces tritici R3-111a-1]|uniref:TeaA receptor TeaR n=1 Tax=Gaeumannomyces tritici (strain R3-111a-1) TaxID=644352 RepID=J3PBK5_GAET3|nr:hypothetical protein GGTG_10877 [Gaeumannomyces tritici R3-111a-1]EJT71622.1 hypothetical protein GGTG_10877 [Gaeumannomyces tritici R3-111a-1]
MTAMSAVPTAASGLTPPSSSHGSGSSNLNGSGYAWNGNYSTAENDEDPMHYKKTAHSYDATNGHQRSPLISQNGYSPSDSPVAPTPKDSESNLTGMAAAANISPTLGSGNAKPSSTRDSATGSSDSLPEAHGGSRGTKRVMRDGSPAGSAGILPDDSKWIHRDKLARIENEELQAAGIFLPAPRSHSRPRHATQERPSDSRKTSDADLHTRSRKNSSAVTGSTLAASSGDPRLQTGTGNWDFRLPEEIAEAEEANYWTSVNGMKGSSRIPVAKVSPAPIPSDVLERDTPARRRRDSSPNDEAVDIKMPRTRARSSSASTKLEVAANAAAASTPQPKRAVTDSSPKKAATDSSPKKTVSVRKGSGKSGGTGRQKTRGAPSKDSTSSASGTTRPSTRSGERELGATSPNARAPEGDPPWMVSAYKPDPRLPPDQQLLPTVAKRLQQEKWEREGKFGSIYDREFRPLTDDGFLSPPEPKDKLSPQPNEKQEKMEDWPLKAEPKSPTAPSLRQQRTGSYSTIPKVQDPPQSPLPPSRGNGAPGQPSPLIRLPDMPDNDASQEKKGCMCCIVM